MLFPPSSPLWGDALSNPKNINFVEHQLCRPIFGPLLFSQYHTSRVVAVFLLLYKLKRSKFYHLYLHSSDALFPLYLSCFATPMATQGWHTAIWTSTAKIHIDMWLVLLDWLPPFSTTATYCFLSTALNAATSKIWPIYMTISPFLNHSSLNNFQLSQFNCPISQHALHTKIQRKKAP